MFLMSLIFLLSSVFLLITTYMSESASLFEFIPSGNIHSHALLYLLSLHMLCC